MNKFEETLKIAEFAEKELDSLLLDVELQSEKLTVVQQKACLARDKMYQSNILMKRVKKFNKSRVIIGCFIVVTITSLILYFELKRF
ncbi:hypothetical protein AAJ76_3400017251 [Vairimorpha ceranae]|uniref:Uncharacterized protein n=1 Tax=Vairimorpha ceranae TaxID=40302 RepID=A0A0F9WQ26_9MICR|nr:hypothetical protein AAJ76_3400017251 [Vairimorpha ceranae]KAF5139882.1 hypothetical protein G9O61_00g019540 [Vairimorpha ceranae]KKO75058.1 hypothetical protein AAJ76_3400017251 [Vairimorpha ceranae]